MYPEGNTCPNTLQVRAKNILIDAKREREKVPEERIKLPELHPLKRKEKKTRRDVRFSFLQKKKVGLGGWHTGIYGQVSKKLERERGFYLNRYFQLQ